MKDLWYAKENHIPVLGHRGIAAKYPENTLPSFEAAIDLGVDLIEFDINVTKDNELVIIHDNSIDRTSDHKGLTRNYTLDELKSFDFSCGKEEFKGVTIPTFREVLTLAVNKSDTLLFNVEIKDMHHETVDATINMLKEFGICERCVIASFDAEIIRYTKKTYPEMRVQGFPGRYMHNFTDETYDCMFGMGISIRNEDDVVKADIELARSKGILVWLYCADTVEAVERCIKLGMDNITGNDPEVALKVFREKGLHK